MCKLPSLGTHGVGCLRAGRDCLCLGLFCLDAACCCCEQAVKALIGPKTKLVSLVHVSNMLGSILPAEEVVSAAHEVKTGCGSPLRNS